MDIQISIYIILGIIFSVGYLIGVLMVRDQLHPDSRNFFYRPAWAIRDKDLSKKGLIFKRMLIAYEIVFFLLLSMCFF